MREWNRIKVDQELVGKEKEKVGMEKEELMEQVSNPDNMLTITVQVQP